ncbi:cell division protein FtsQ/DivIB [Beijerinckia indica]|nr:FtsQ-type POTRA domain-containing protein [Beijerinckia indica]
MSMILALSFLGAVGLYGAIKGGEYAAFVAEYGEPQDLAAKAMGFGIKAVTIAGTRELSEDEILAQAGIGTRNSLLFLDVAAVRANLLNLALVKSVSVSKLFPNRLLIEVEERQPFALWQKDGKVQVVARDGKSIDWLRDDRFLRLPLVTGDGANNKLDEYLGLLDAAGDLREQIRAGIYVANRRWTLSMRNGVEVLLPEDDPKAAVAALVTLQRQSHVLDKDVISLDFRQPGRMVAHLSAEAAAERAEMLAHKTAKKKGG